MSGFLRKLRASLVCFSLFFVGCGGGGSGDVAVGATDSNGAAITTTTNTAATAGTGGAVNTGGANVAATPVPSQVDIDLRAAMNNAGVVAAAVPATQDPNKVALGRALMFDKILSGNKDVSCATCHAPGLGTGDALSVSIGTGGVGAGQNRVLGAGRSFIARNAPPLYNLNGVDTMFWDGRVHNNNGTLETPAGNLLPAGLDSALAAQAMFPVTSRDEMRGQSGDVTVDSQANEVAVIGDGDLVGQWTALMNRLRAIPGYVALFQSAYPGVATNNLGFEHAANAIAAFEIDQFGTLNSPFDRYIGGDDTALSDQQKQGALLFYGRARCAACHRGALLSDFQFHNIATPQVGPGVGAAAPLDLGRFEETGQNADRFRFRTPPLRNVALTGPWMHSGPYASLEAVVGHYRNPGASLQNYNANQLRGDLQSLVFTQQQLNANILNNLDPVLQTPIALNNQDVADIVAFLNALTDPTAVQRATDIPANVPSGLPVND